LQRETGLGEVEIVAGSVHDTGAAVAAVPAEGADDWAYLSSGTWSLIGVELPAPLITDEARLANFTNETGVGGTSRFLRNAGGLWILQECKRAWTAAGQEYSYETLAAQAAQAEPFRTLIPPDHPRFLRPADMLAEVRATAESTGQLAPETPGQFARCVFESQALLYGRMLDLVESVTKRHITRLHIVGGGSKNDVLNQMTADATGRTVIAGPVEATAVGNILLQSLTHGHIRTHAELRQIVRNSFPLQTFTPSNSVAWSEAEARFQRLFA
jgi:rhamnulokinase